MAVPFDAYHQWLGIPAEEQPPNHYRLLGIKTFEDDPNVIEHAADRQMAHLRTFQAGKYAAMSQSLLNEVAAAKLCLLNPQKKAEYDQRLRRELEAGHPQGGEMIDPDLAALIGGDAAKAGGQRAGKPQG